MIVIRRLGGRRSAPAADPLHDRGRALIDTTVGGFEGGKREDDPSDLCVSVDGWRHRGQSQRERCSQDIAYTMGPA